MAKKAICDECGTVGPLSDHYGTIPDTWYTLTQKYTGVHLCSRACLRAHLNKGELQEADQGGGDNANIDTAVAHV